MIVIKGCVGTLNGKLTRLNTSEASRVAVFLIALYGSWLPCAERSAVNPYYHRHGTDNMIPASGSGLSCQLIPGWPNKALLYDVRKRSLPLSYLRL